jgi:hypothetical protein
MMHLGIRKFYDVFPKEVNRIRPDLGRRLRQQAHHRKHRYAFATTTFSHDAQRLSLLQRIRDAIHGMDDTVLGMKFCP